MPEKYGFAALQKLFGMVKKWWAAPTNKESPKNHQTAAFRF